MTPFTSSEPVLMEKKAACPAPADCPKSKVVLRRQAELSLSMRRCFVAGLAQLDAACVA
jgi:hypothetical protein